MARAIPGGKRGNAGADHHYGGDAADHQPAAPALPLRRHELVKLFVGHFIILSASGAKRLMRRI
jgi:hypothetical protein